MVVNVGREAMTETLGKVSAEGDTRGAGSKSEEVSSLLAQRASYLVTHH